MIRTLADNPELLVGGTGIFVAVIAVFLGVFTRN
jgi:hypothetical protein